MGHLMSAIEKIDTAYFDRMKNGKVIKVSKAIRFGRNVIFQDEKGRLYTDHQGLAGNNAFLPNGGGWEPDLLRALVALGVITKDDMNAHLERAKKHSVERAKKSAAVYLVGLAKTHGFKISAEQKRKLGISE